MADNYAPGAPTGPPNPPLSSGGDGAGTQQFFIDRAPSAPDETSLPAQSYNSSTGVTSVWSPDTLSWT